MPTPCAEPRCPNAATGPDRRCDKHSRRASSLPRDWKRTRREVLNRSSLCRLCRFRLATEVEQIVPGDDYGLANLRGVCWRCSRRERTDLGSTARRPGNAGQALTQQIPGLPDEPPAGQGLVVVIGGPGASGSRFLLDSDVNTAGRHPDAAVFLNDVTVSRAHAEFFRPPESGRFEIRDLGSTNGTYVNQERVERAPLRRGDEIRIGNFELVFLADA